MPKTQQGHAAGEHPRLNADWHRQNKMPKNPSLAVRIAWHEAHAKVCGCRPMPDSIAAALKSRAE